MKKVAAIFNVAKNKYLLALTIFVLWISFFDRNDLFTQYDRKQELNKLQASADFYQKEIETTRKDLTALNNDPAVLEKMAREKFYLKRKGEELFIVVDSAAEKK